VLRAGQSALVPALRQHHAQPGGQGARARLPDPYIDFPPVFQDVPNTSPFYHFVNTVGSLGLMNGYQCGGPGEPCLPGNVPYFRPYNNITRAQLSKVVVLARGWPLLNPPTRRSPMFRPASPFYTFVETAAAAHIING